VNHTVPSGDGATSCGALPDGTAKLSNEAGRVCATLTSATHASANAATTQTVLA
jgi:hypothetical protein